MTTRYTWNELQKLVAIDHEIHHIKQQLAVMHKEEEEAAHHIPELEKQNALIEKALHDLAKQADLIDITIAQKRESERKKKRVLENTVRPKEYTALEKELETLEYAISEQESALTKLWEQQEAYEQKKEAVTSQLSQAQQRVAEKKATHAAAHASLNQQLRSCNEAWDAQAEQVPQDLRLTYDAIRARVENPVVPIVSGSCTACFTSLLHQDRSALTKKTIIRCRGCYRFLHLPVDEEEEANE